MGKYEQKVRQCMHIPYSLMHELQILNIEQKQAVDVQIG